MVREGRFNMHGAAGGKASKVESKGWRFGDSVSVLG